MDGSPSRGETIPIRLFLGGFDLTPTFRDVNKKFSTRYYLSLVLIDEDARRYFKQSEIILYRQAPDALEAADGPVNNNTITSVPESTRKPMPASPPQQQQQQQVAAA